MSDRTKHNPRYDVIKQDGIILGGSTWLDEDGNQVIGVDKVAPTPEMLDAIMEKDKQKFMDFTGSYVTTDELTEGILALKDKSYDLPFEPADFEDMLPNDCGPGNDAAAQEEQGPDNRPFVGARLVGKVKPKNMPVQGKDPLGIRKFVGDEFPRMLAYGPPEVERVILQDENGQPYPANKLVKEAEPAFYSHWPKGTALKDMKKINVNIATKVPEYMKKDTVAASMEARRNVAFGGQSLEEAFTPITEKVERAWRRFAKDFKETYGIELDVRRDDSDHPHAEEDINISVMGFARGERQLAGFANFPDAINDWRILRGLGHKQGYMMLNHEYTNNPLNDEETVYDLIYHEMGHFFGFVHPHDLGAMKMTQPEALASTAMAYTDGKFTKFPDQKGTTCGVVDLFFRNYMDNPPPINTSHGMVYDMESQFADTLKKHYKSTVVARTSLMPFTPILNNGTGAVLQGTTFNDILDTEQGHTSFCKNPFGIVHGYTLVEGHFEKVVGRAGNNHIIASSKGSQDIYPGPGSNHIHIYASNIGNNKILHCQGPGQDKLVLHQDIFIANNKKLNVTRDGSDIVFETDGGRIVLKDQLHKDKGISYISVVDDNGRTVLEQNVERFKTANRFKQDIVATMQRHVSDLPQEEETQDKAAHSHAQSLLERRASASNLQADNENVPPLKERLRWLDRVDTAATRAKGNAR